MRYTTSTLIAFLLFTLPLIQAQSPKDIPNGGKEILPSPNPAQWIITGTDHVKHHELPASSSPIRGSKTNAIEISILKKPEREWSIQLQSLTSRSIQKGDVALISFWARSIRSSDESGRARLNLYFQRTSPPWNKYYFRHLVLSEEWKFYCFPFEATESYAKDEAALYLGLGFLPQTLQIHGLRVTNYGSKLKRSDLPITETKLIYKGMDPDAPWRQAAAQHIEQHRKGDFTLTLTHPGGKALANQKLQIEMVRHAYPFGTAVVAKGLAGKSAADLKYQQIIKDNYNHVVFENDLKHGPWTHGRNAPASAYFSRMNLIKAMQWLKLHQIQVRGHTLLWGPIRKDGYNRLLDFSSRNSIKASQRLIEQHMQDVINTNYPQVKEWDVLNHPVARFGDRGQRLDHVYGPDFYTDFIKSVRRTNPELQLYINEGNVIAGNGVTEDYFKLTQTLIKAGAGPDGIGFMCHFAENSLIGMDQLYQMLERFAQFKLPLKATELDITTEDEAGQAAYMRDFMTLWFSHPKTSGIIMWGFWEGRHWRPQAALYRKDFSIKPVGQAWLDLVKKEWWTQTSATTDAKGQIQFRGFYGDYRVILNGQVIAEHLSFTRKQTSNKIQLK